MNYVCNAKDIVNIILETNLLKKISLILVWKINKRIDNYNKNKNQRLIMLTIKFKEYNNQYSYKLMNIYCVYSNYNYK